MNYMLLIYNAEAGFAALSDAERGAFLEECERFHESIVKSGHFRAGEVLHPTSAATTVRVRNGKRTITDGPFAETKEQLTGYFLIDANDLDEAIAIAGRLPAARFGSIEIRPVREEPVQRGMAAAPVARHASG